MSPHHLFQQLQLHSLFSCRVGFSRSIFVKPKHFAPYRRYFEQDKFQKNKLRYGGLFYNLHAYQAADGTINIHTDYGNPNKNILIGSIVHGVVDCPLYTVMSFLRTGKLITMPTIKNMQTILNHHGP